MCHKEDKYQDCVQNLREVTIWRIVVLCVPTRLYLVHECGLVFRMVYLNVKGTNRGGCKRLLYSREKWSFEFDTFFFQKLRLAFECILPFGASFFVFSFSHPPSFHIIHHFETILGPSCSSHEKCEDQLRVHTTVQVPIWISTLPRGSWEDPPVKLQFSGHWCPLTLG